MINPEQIFHFDKDQSFNINVDNELFINWNVPKALPYFEGHFPDNPILPAIALLDLSLVILNRINSKLKGTFLTIKSAKFSEVIRPDDSLVIKARLDQSNQSWTLEFTNQHQVNVSKLVVQVI